MNDACLAFLNLFFPKRCVSCREPVHYAGNSCFCAPCRGKIRSVPDPICRRCGLHLPDGGALCHDCRHEPMSADTIRCASLFEGPIRHALHAFKYGGKENLGGELADILYQAWKSGAEWREAQIITPVPLHPARLRERGYNQSRILAEKLHQKIKSQTLELVPFLLERTRNTPSQTKLSRDERALNLQDAFRVKDGGPSLKGKTVLLIDDVCTTGATFSACARALKDAGAKKVHALAIARD